MTIARKLTPLFLFVLMLAVPFLANAQTTVVLTVAPTPPAFGANALLQATVTPASASGKVTFYDGVNVLGTKALVSGVAVMNTIQLAAGAHKVKAYYLGDATNGPASSNIVNTTITPLTSAGLASRSPLSVTATGLLAIGDFNNDGKADLVFRNSAALSVVLGDGTGNFITPGYSITIGGLTPVAAAVADFNGDGFPDLVVGSSSSSTVSILLGKGDGTFQSPVAYPVSNALNGLAVADFNGDGVPDLAVGNVTENAAALINNGPGQFTLSAPYTVSAAAQGVVVGDFNDDGFADFATFGQLIDNVNLLLGDGKGNFRDGGLLHPGGNWAAYPTGGVVGDFNHDTRPDLAFIIIQAGIAGLLGSQQPSV